jgi:LytS/YehU family sensor histidine kinase
MFTGMFLGIMLALLERTRVHGWRHVALVCVALAIGGALLTLGDIIFLGTTILNENIHAGVIASRWSWFLSSYWLTIAFGGLGLLLQVSARRAQEATQRLRAAEMDRQTAQKNVVESRLSAMQARVEPQFLFDALDRIQHAYLRDPDGAERQLDHLITYLRAALPQVREGSSTLGREAMLIEAYLRVLDGDSAMTSFEDATPVELRLVELPPMLLLPLIEAALGQTPSHASPNRRVAFGGAVAGSRLEVTLRVAEAAAPDAALHAALERTLDTLLTLYPGAAEAGMVRPTPTTVQIKLAVPYER